MCFVRSGNWSLASYGAGQYGRRVYGIPIMVVASILFPTNIARAGGDILTRIADTAKVGARGVIPDCAGRLIERYAEEANVRGFSFSLDLICSASPSAAKWVLISGTSCYDETDVQRKCSRPELKAIPAFNATPNYYEDVSPPFLMKYQLVKYAIGRECHVITQNYSSIYSQSDHAEAWLCEKLDIFDGIHAATRKDGLLKKTLFVTVETAAVRPLAEEGRGRQSGSGFEFSFPDTFLVSPRLYNLNLAIDMIP